jgi:hypothetical protein
MTLKLSLPDPIRQTFPIGLLGVRWNLQCSINVAPPRSLPSFITTKSKMKRALATLQHSLAGPGLVDVGDADMSQAHSPPVRDNMKESDWKGCDFARLTFDGPRSGQTV